ncbi:alanine racemase, partial [Candidatus Omnitrophota bacterium]
MKQDNVIGYRPAWAEVDLSNLRFNIGQVRRIAGARTKIMACVKADAYGHGLIAVSRALVSCGADYLGVASIDEGIMLRRAGIRRPILVLGIVLKKDIAPLFKYKLSTTVCTEELCRALNRMGRKSGKKLSVHIKVDTGMGRIGVLDKKAAQFAKSAFRLSHLNIEGIFTHLASADTDRKFTLRQIDKFSKLVGGLKDSGIDIPLVHAANSMGLIGYKDSHFNMVRPGLVIYGLYPKSGLSLPLKPLLSLKARIVYIKRVPKGWGISYGSTYVTKRNTAIATIPIGYGDGYPRNLSNKAPLLVNGKRFKISG